MRLRWCRCLRLPVLLHANNQKERKYQYQVNFTRSIHILRSFLRIKKGGKHPPDIESILSKEIEPIRHGRTNSRKIKPKSVVYFTYRFN